MVVSFAKCLQFLCHVLVKYGHVLLQLLLSQCFELKKRNKRERLVTIDGAHDDPACTRHTILLDALQALVYSPNWARDQGHHPGNQSIWLYMLVTMTCTS